MLQIKMQPVDKILLGEGEGKGVHNISKNWLQGLTITGIVSN